MMYQADVEEGRSEIIWQPFLQRKTQTDREETGEYTDEKCNLHIKMQ